MASGRYRLDMPATYLKGVGPSRAAALRKLGVLAVYPATEGLSFKVIRSILDANLDPLLDLVEEYLPRSLLDAVDVPAIGEALRLVHRPESVAEAMRGRSRLAFEELFFVHLLH